MTLITDAASTAPAPVFALDTSTMRYVEGRFVNARGKRMFYCAFFPPPSAQLLRGVVLFLHGIGEHSHRFTHVYKHLLAHGYGVVAYDLAGHGRSESEVSGVRAYAANFDDFVDDTNRFVALAKTTVIPAMVGEEAVATAPLVFMGISFGTLVGLHTVLSGEHAFSAIVLASPAINVDYNPVLSALALVSKPLSWLLPTCKAVPGVNQDGLSRDPAFLDDYLSDPLNAPECLAMRMGEQIMAAMAALANNTQCEQSASSFCALPILIVHGSGDTVTSLPMARAFFDRIANADKEFRVFDGLFHCILDEPEKAQVLEHIRQWLVARVDGSTHTLAPATASE